MPQLTLVDGRALAFEEWGEPTGRPLVFLHGSPGSRLCVPDERATRVAGVRVVTWDRPGYGRSDRAEGRALLDTAHDLAQLVDALDIERFSLLGVSGGGPHALGCAWSLGARIESIALVASPGPLDEVPGAWDALGDHMRPTARAARVEPRRAARAVERYMQGWVDDPTTYVGPGGPAADRVVKSEPRWRRFLVAEVEEGFRPGAGGLADDLVAFWRPWGFSPASVSTPAWLAHGLEDRRALPDFRFLASNLPSARTRTWSDAGHLAIVAHWQEVLRASTTEP